MADELEITDTGFLADGTPFFEFDPPGDAPIEGGATIGVPGQTVEDLIQQETGQQTSQQTCYTQCDDKCQQAVQDAIKTLGDLGCPVEVHMKNSCGSKSKKSSCGCG